MAAVITDNAQRLFQERYLVNSETTDDLFDRVSGGNTEYRDMMANLLFLPNSPTLFNMGLPSGGTLSACFVFEIQDCLLGDWPDGGLDSPFPSSILGTTFKAAAVAKAGGGVGYFLGNIRPEGTEVKSTHRKACGPVAVLRWLHGLRSLITQGGKRDLAQMGVLNVGHPDIRKFIHAKDEDPKALESFNISVDWNDKWMDRVSHTIEGTPESYKYNEETDLWWEQCNAAWRTGDPGMLFGDTINRFHAAPHLGRIKATNPCGEVPNLSDEPCNLGSLNLWRFMEPFRGRWRMNWSKLKQYVALATKFLDDILDWNTFPHPDITAAAQATRKLGLGVMGLADVFALLRMPYDSQDAVDLSTEIAKTINDEALETSIEMGRTKGVYPAWATGSPDTKDRFPAARNSTRTSVAPTGTIAILANANSSIEPYFALEWDRTTNEGIKLHERIAVAEHLGDHVPKLAGEIALEWHIKHQAAWQKHVNLGVSKTINLPNNATVSDISRAYMMMWKEGCKGGTVFRDGCRSEQVLVATKKSVYATGTDPIKPTEEKMPKVREGKTFEARIDGHDVYLTANRFADGRVGEIFLLVGKAGATIDGMTDAWAMQVSKSLQYGMPLERIVKMYAGRRGEPSGLTSDPVVPICSSIQDYVVRRLQAEFLPTPVVGVVVPIYTNGTTTRPAFTGLVNSGMVCPKCSKALYSLAGCLTCVEQVGGCGYSKCG
jgi:ribonucleoside-diphosphate reductase alpha chain